MQRKNHVDFASSIIISLVSVATIFYSFYMYNDAGEPLMYLSPAFLPLIMSCAMLLFSMVLMFRSLKKTDGGGGAYDNIAKLKSGFSEFVKSPTTKTAIVGLAFMAIYTFVLLPVVKFPPQIAFLHFPVMSFIFLIIEMRWLKAGGWIKICVVSALSVTALYVMFAVAFGVMLP